MKSLHSYKPRPTKLKNYIIPSIIAKNQQELDERMKVALKSGSKVIQLDVMDGHFVKNNSLNFDFEIPEHKGLIYEAHLMMRNPMPWIHKNHRKVDIIIVHYESNFLKEAVDFIRHHNCKVGIALSPRTNVEHYESLDYTFVDTLLIMTVNPGKYGSKFLSKMIPKVKEAREKYPKINIEVDGSVNNKTIKDLHKAGANKFIVGSYLQKSDDPKNTVRALKQILSSRKK